MTAWRARTAFAVVAASLAGCGLMPSASSPLTPGTQWRVAAVDGEPVREAELILTVLADSSTLSSECGASVGPLETTSGQDLAFGRFDGPAGGQACPQAALAAHRRVVEALAGVERWQPAGEGTELVGDEHVIRLEGQRTDT